MGKAISINNACLLAILDQSENLQYAENPTEFKVLALSKPGLIWIHNQNPEAIETMENMSYAEGQLSLEVFQDTEGVFGLRAYKMIAKIQTPEVLELKELT